MVIEIVIPDMISGVQSKWTLTEMSIRMCQRGCKAALPACLPATISGAFMGLTTSLPGGEHNHTHVLCGEHDLCMKNCLGQVIFHL